jgi:hypothetical protein
MIVVGAASCRERAAERPRQGRAYNDRVHLQVPVTPRYKLPGQVSYLAV